MVDIAPLHLESIQPPAALSRRQLLMGAGTLAMLGAAGQAFAAEAAGGGLITASQECVSSGQACLSHCFAMFKTGDTSLAQCAVLVHETVAVCAAMAQLALTQSKHLKAYANVCVGICQDCEQECRKHSQHTVCVRMADACAATVKEARQAAA